VKTFRLPSSFNGGFLLLLGKNFEKESISMMKRQYYSLWKTSKKNMYIADWIQRLDVILQLNGREF